MDKYKDQLQKLVSPNFNSSWTQAKKKLDEWHEKCLPVGSPDSGFRKAEYLSAFAKILCSHFSRCCNAILEAIKKQGDSKIIPSKPEKIKVLVSEILSVQKKAAEENMLKEIGGFFVQGSEDYISKKEWFMPKLIEACNSCEEKLKEEMNLYFQGKCKEAWRSIFSIVKSIMAEKWFYVAIASFYLILHKKILNFASWF